MLAQDIVIRIQKDYGDADEADLVLSVLEDFIVQNPNLSDDRILRCIILVSGGELDGFEEELELAKIDFRDLIVMAEYNHKFERIRDLTLPFEN